MVAASFLRLQLDDAKARDHVKAGILREQGGVVGDRGSCDPRALDTEVAVPGGAHLDRECRERRRHGAIDRQSGQLLGVAQRLQPRGVSPALSEARIGAGLERTQKRAYPPHRLLLSPGEAQERAYFAPGTRTQAADCYGRSANEFPVSVRSTRK